MRLAPGGDAAADALEPGTALKRARHAPAPAPAPAARCPAAAEAPRGGPAGAGSSAACPAAGGATAARGALRRRLQEVVAELRALTAADDGAVDYVRVAGLAAVCGRLAAALAAEV